MNNKFFSLSLEKQNKILNAAYKVFSNNIYRKASMLDIAKESEVSKSLLFHYFYNKQTLYLYLWDFALKKTREISSEFKVTETKDFFEMLKRNLIAKCTLIRKYPYLNAFCLKAYYEPDLEIQKLIQLSVHKIVVENESLLLETMRGTEFRTDIDVNLMYREICWTADGYLRQRMLINNWDTDEVEKDFLAFIEQWKKIYLA
ncbi:TetR/AcrR family transcriptional regulator [Lysinibacillus sp. NPDC097287]|uniref:TetR/AcrR family transcriptional regulator n=1 Tax=Lysinibacillus sp. NPDC097287 TaxID=3364144 RepID=UPI003809D2E1